MEHRPIHIYHLSGPSNLITPVCSFGCQMVSARRQWSVLY